MGEICTKQDATLELDRLVVTHFIARFFANQDTCARITVSSICSTLKGFLPPEREKFHTLAL